MSTYPDPLTLMITLALLALLPIIVVLTTSFVKIVVVLALVRNALGVQQVPPNIALHALALILTVYIMAPALNTMYDTVSASITVDTPDLRGQVERPIGSLSSQPLTPVFRSLADGVEPLRAFMVRNARPEQRDFFLATAHRLWGEPLASGLKDDDMVILMPAFLVSELTHAFEIGFLLYLPFVVIDLIVSNVLLALGMMMVSPVTLAMPLKLFLFVMVDGWTRLIQGLVLSYA